MFQVRQSDHFASWLNGLADIRGKKKIARRLIRLQAGLLGDVKFFDGIGEMRIDYGPGYRVYFVRRDNVVFVLLCGGNKSSQARDIRKAREMAKEF